MRSLLLIDPEVLDISKLVAKSDSLDLVREEVSFGGQVSILFHGIEIVRELHYLSHLGFEIKLHDNESASRAVLEDFKKACEENELEVDSPISLPNYRDVGLKRHEQRQKILNECQMGTNSGFGSYVFIYDMDGMADLQDVHLAKQQGFTVILVDPTLEKEEENQSLQLKRMPLHNAVKYVKEQVRKQQAQGRMPFYPLATTTNYWVANAVVLFSQKKQSLARFSNSLPRLPASMRVTS